MALVPRVSQWAETLRRALGRGSSCPQAGQAAREGGIADRVHGAAVADENHRHALPRLIFSRRLGVRLPAQRLQRCHRGPSAYTLQP